jgi:hypothetical protein
MKMTDIKIPLSQKIILRNPHRFMQKTQQVMIYG